MAVSTKLVGTATGAIVRGTGAPDVQAVSLVDSAGNTLKTVDNGDGTASLSSSSSSSVLTVSTATLANAASSASSVTLFTSNANARGRTVYNDSTAVLYVKFGGTASATSFTVAVQPAGYYEFPTPLYTGVVDGIWASANGNARTTEV